MLNNYISTIWHPFRVCSAILLAVFLGSCGGNSTPTPIDATMTITLNPNATEVIPDQEVAIVPDLEPNQSVTFNWRVEGSAGGTLSTSTGPAAIYKAGQAGVDIVTLEAALDDGTIIASEAISFNVMAPPTDTPVPTDVPTATLLPTEVPTETPTDIPPPTSRPDCNELASTRIPLSSPPAEGRGEIVGPAHCADDIPTPPEPVEAYGTYSAELEGRALWLLAYPPNRLYYPQRESGKDEAGTCWVAEPDMGLGQWRVNVSLGRDGVPEKFDLVLVTTAIGSEADIRFKEWLLNGCNTGNFPGFSRSDLPSGLIELDAITIHTR